jgi:hypothetical protein
VTSAIGSNRATMAMVRTIWSPMRNAGQIASVGSVLAGRGIPARAFSASLTRWCSSWSNGVRWRWWRSRSSPAHATSGQFTMACAAAGLARESRAKFVVAASADAVWDVIGRRFDRIGEWATAIPASTAIARTVTPLPVGQIIGGAPVAGRVCATGVRLVPRVTETLVAYDGTNRTLTYEASGLPAFVTTARNTWTVIALDDRRCPVTLRARFVTRGLLGHLGRWAILAQVGRTSRYLAEDLRRYVETGRPSPRKQRQLRRAARRAAR